MYVQKRIDELNNYLLGFKNQLDIVAISKTKLKTGLINRNIELEGSSVVLYTVTVKSESLGLVYILKIRLNIE